MQIKEPKNRLFIQKLEYFKYKIIEKCAKMKYNYV